MKVTEPGLNKLIDNLNTLICEDSLLTRQERETLVLAVAAIGAMKARVGLKKAMRRPKPDGKKGRKRPPACSAFSASRSSLAGRRKNLTE